MPVAISRHDQHRGKDPYYKKARIHAHEAALRVSLALQSRIGLNLSEIDNILTTVGVESDLQCYPL
jgi:hypothetical protein